MQEEFEVEGKLRLSIGVPHVISLVMTSHRFNEADAYLSRLEASGVFIGHIRAPQIP